MRVMNQNLFSSRHSGAELLVSIVLVAALLLTPAASYAGAVGPNRSFANRHVLTPASSQGSVVSATVSRVGSDFQVSWTTTGDVEKVRVEEGTSHEQIANLVGEVSGITIMTVTGLDPTSAITSASRAEEAMGSLRLNVGCRRSACSTSATSAATRP
jgi:hypothetical protein